MLGQRSITLRKGETHAHSIFTVGFCMGGGLSLRAGMQDFGLAGVVGFYAGLSCSFGGGPTVLEDAANIHVPVLGLFGGADQGIPVEQVHELDAKLYQAGVEHDIVIYPGTPHSFFDRKYDEFAKELPMPDPRARFHWEPYGRDGLVSVEASDLFSYTNASREGRHFAVQVPGLRAQGFSPDADEGDDKYCRV